MLLLNVLTCAIAVLQIANCRLAEKETLLKFMDNYLGASEMQKTWNPDYIKVCEELPEKAELYEFSQLELTKVFNFVPEGWDAYLPLMFICNDKV